MTACTLAAEVKMLNMKLNMKEQMSTNKPDNPCFRNFAEVKPRGGHFNFPTTK